MKVLSIFDLSLLAEDHRGVSVLGDLAAIYI
jgi:hypothetical protein